MGMLGRAISALVLLTLAGCSSMKPEQFENTKPTLNLFSFFEGHTTAWGIFEDRFGNLRRQFVVNLDGNIEGDTLTLDEDFTYRDGEKKRRVWTITKTGENTYEGKADDIIGIAKGISSGSTFNWKYEMNLEVDKSLWHVKFNDWLFLQPGGVIINRATVTRWGFEIGTVTLSFMKDG